MYSSFEKRSLANFILGQCAIKPGDGLRSRLMRVEASRIFSVGRDDSVLSSLSKEHRFDNRDIFFFSKSDWNNSLSETNSLGY